MKVLTFMKKIMVIASLVIGVQSTVFAQGTYEMKVDSFDKLQLFF